MNEPRDLDKLIRWGEGAAVAMLILVALWSLPLLMFLFTWLGLDWRAAPCISSFLVALALLIDFWARRKPAAAQTPISDEAAEAAKRSFHARIDEHRRRIRNRPGPIIETLDRSETRL